MDSALPSTLRIAAIDLNGQLRGKRIPSEHEAKLAKGGARLPISALNLDIWGCDIDDSPLVFESGDQDGILTPSTRGAVPMPWLSTASSLTLMQMLQEDGAPYLGEPMAALSEVLSRFDARGWTVMAATEMEFTLVDDKGEALHPPHSPRDSRRLAASEVLSVDELDSFDALFSEIYNGATAMGIPLQTMTCESGIGQFEVTLNHQPAMKAAQDALLIKQLIRATARKHGVAATFMAKPYADDAGNGMHVHFSVVDKTGANVFDDGSAEGSDLLRHAVAGCLAAMRASTLIFAPHGPSYDRFAPGAHAPTSVCWGYENRTAALRIPGGSPAARRIEHRVAGGDVNPVLMLASVLSAAFVGIEESMTPPAPVVGNAYAQEQPQLAESWEAAIDLFEQDAFIARCLPAELIRNLVMTKRQELRKLADIPTEQHWQTYLERV
ncbi:glutamine synthetase [Shimia sp. R10_1]|uniref:glutamine synthetase family protein n=1 Tax=Shimia sp. R10_1 TaxID=2821095 RepID=UPI001ADCC995|nr:glutamine synthetase family protein [Shimia sp. R10_1]MBO9472438.1 glutamine synthetase [Shimia sp. R10_1]